MGTIMIAIFESDDIVRVIQRKLRILYPEITIPSNTIRRILRDKALCQELLTDERLPSAQAQLVRANARPAGKRRKSTFTVRPAVPLSAKEEPLSDILRYDMNYGSCGG
jgi:hypothetical protein